MGRGMFGVATTPVGIESGELCDVMLRGKMDRERDGRRASSSHHHHDPRSMKSISTGDGLRSHRAL